MALASQELEGFEGFEAAEAEAEAEAEADVTAGEPLELEPACGGLARRLVMVSSLHAM